MDRTTIRAVEATTHMGLDVDAGALVLVQFDSGDAEALAEHAAVSMDRAGATDVVFTADVDEGEQFLHARRMALVSLERLGTTMLDDVCVPTTLLGALVEAVEAISERWGVTIGTFGHAGDGNLHPTIVFDADLASQRTAALAAFDDIVEATMSLGGSITGEHGVGLLKAPYLDRAIGDRERRLMRDIKGVFDPEGLLNPGKGY
jgi:D-lactate dehydrogenase (cytochrome)/glycolate oxidase